MVLLCKGSEENPLVIEEDDTFFKRTELVLQGEQIASFPKIVLHCTNELVDFINMLFQLKCLDTR